MFWFSDVLCFFLFCFCFPFGFLTQTFTGLLPLTLSPLPPGHSVILDSTVSSCVDSASCSDSPSSSFPSSPSSSSTPPIFLAERSEVSQIPFMDLLLSPIASSFLPQPVQQISSEWEQLFPHLMHCSLFSVVSFNFGA